MTALRNSDLEHVVNLYTDPDVRRYLGGPVTEEQIRPQFSKFIHAESSNLNWAIRLKRESVFIGTVSIGTHHNGIDNEILYQFRPKWWGQGYATETIRAVIDYASAELGMTRLIAETQTANIASCRLLERLGMQREQTLERYGAKQAVYATRRQHLQ